MQESDSAGEDKSESSVPIPLSELDKFPDSTIRSQLGNVGINLKSFDDASLKALNAQDIVWHNQSRRKIATDLLRSSAWSYVIVKTIFIIASTAALIFMFMSSQWSTEHKDVIEILKFGWTVSATVIVGKVSALIFNDNNSKM